MRTISTKLIVGSIAQQSTHELINLSIRVYEILIDTQEVFELRESKKNFFFVILNEIKLALTVN